jgi:fumarate hydratase class II
MIAIQVLGNDSAVAFARSQGNFELNAMRPVVINNFLHSARILADGIEKFRTFSVSGTELNREKFAQHVNESLMLVMAMSPVIGYQNVAHIAESALANGQTLKEAALACGYVDEKTLGSVVDPLSMVGHEVSGA